MMKIRHLLLPLTLCSGFLLSPTLSAKEKLSAVPKEKRHVYLLIGQSNMAGRATYDKADEASVPRCFLLNDDDQWEPAKNPLNRYSTIRKSLKIQRMNPGYGFAQSMTAADPSVIIGLVVNAKGGTKISQWGKGTEFYNEAVRRAKEAQKSGTLMGILWHQGEGDSRRSSSYMKSLAKLIADLRKDLNAPQLPFIAGQVYYDAKNKPNTEKINKVIAKLPEEVPLTAYVSSEGLTTFDHTHFDAAGSKELGKRYAEAMLKLHAKTAEAPAGTSAE